MAFTLRESTRAGVTGTVSGSFTPGEKIGESKERGRKGLLREEQRPSLVEVGGGRRTRERRGCVRKSPDLWLGVLPIFLLGDEQVASNVESQLVFCLALTQK